MGGEPEVRARRTQAERVESVLLEHFTTRRARDSITRASFKVHGIAQPSDPVAGPRRYVLAPVARFVIGLRRTSHVANVTSAPTTSVIRTPTTPCRFAIAARLS